jgi:hypothetical protein
LLQPFVGVDELPERGMTREEFRPVRRGTTFRAFQVGREHLAQLRV